MFATFYEELYARRQVQNDDEPCFPGPPGQTSVEPFKMDELTGALRKMMSGKAAHGSGVVAEMLKNGRMALHETLLGLFNDILVAGAAPPETWRKTKLKVLFKKGDPKMPKNYRPIAMIQIMYKLFSRMLCRRVQDAVLRPQTPDQAAYRPGYSTDDHLLAMTLLFERCREWNQDLWIGMVDFEKAFDTVDHASMWEILRDIGVHCDYIKILQRLYASQHATVDVGVESRQFNVERGVKQGDPISGLLFLAVMQACSRELKTKWNNLNRRRLGQYFGVVVDDPEDPLTSLLFADDVLFFSQSRADIKKMVEHLQYGLCSRGWQVRSQDERREDKNPDKYNPEWTTVRFNNRRKH